MKKLLIALMTAAFAATPAYVTAQAKDEKKVEAKKEEKKAVKEEKKAMKEEKKEEKKEVAKKKPKGGC